MSKPTTATATTADTPRTAASAPEPRGVYEIEVDLEAAQRRFRDLEPKVRDHAEKRRRALTRREKLEADWKKQNPDDPFDPDAFNPPAVVPPQAGPDQRDFHAAHYRIASLEKEMELAKRRLVEV